MDSPKAHCQVHLRGGKPYWWWPPAWMSSPRRRKRPKTIEGGKHFLKMPNHWIGIRSSSSVTVWRDKVFTSLLHSPMCDRVLLLFSSQSLSLQRFTVNFLIHSHLQFPYLEPWWSPAESTHLITSSTFFYIPSPTSVQAVAKGVSYSMQPHPPVQPWWHQERSKRQIDSFIAHSFNLTSSAWQYILFKLQMKFLLIE